LLSREAFTDLLERVKAGDPEAAAELIRHCEPDIRLEVRVRLRAQDGRMRRLLDSMDITQSVLGSFFVGVAAGRFNLENPQQLFGLLLAMTRNKLLKKVRYQRQQQRDICRVQAFDPAWDVPGRSETPSQIVAWQELLGEFHKRLTEEERQIAERRRQGQPWEAIAAELGGTANSRRKQLQRAFARVAQQLGLEDEFGSSLAS
jgi:RNA polymerase sigma-70 factor (ECF subfamily)